MIDKSPRILVRIAKCFIGYTTTMRPFLCNFCLNSSSHLFPVGILTRCVSLLVSFFLTFIFFNPWLLMIFLQSSTLHTCVVSHHLEFVHSSRAILFPLYQKSFSDDLGCMFYLVPSLLMWIQGVHISINYSVFTSLHLYICY